MRKNVFSFAIILILILSSISLVLNSSNALRSKTENEVSSTSSTLGNSHWVEIDKENVMGDRSAFVSNLLEKQLNENITTMDASTELLNRMNQTGEPLGLSGEISLLNSQGQGLGKFDINTVEGFENLAKKIGEISDDPIVRMKVRRWW